MKYFGYNNSIVKQINLGYLIIDTKGLDSWTRKSNPFLSTLLKICFPDTKKELPLDKRYYLAKNFQGKGIAISKLDKSIKHIPVINFWDITNEDVPRFNHPLPFNLENETLIIE